MQLPVARYLTFLSLATLNSYRRTQTCGDSHYGESICPASLNVPTPGVTYRVTTLSAFYSFTTSISSGPCGCHSPSRDRSRSEELRQRCRQ